MSGSPPAVDEKKLVPRMRLNISRKSAPESTGVPITIMMDVATMAQAIRGTRDRLMPFARMLKMVTRKFSPPKMEEKPMNWSEMAHSVCPVCVVRLSGGYAVQPLSAPPTAKAASMRIAPGTISQNERALRRGNAMSSWPNCSGTT